MLGNFIQATTKQQKKRFFKNNSLKGAGKTFFSAERLFSHDFTLKLWQDFCTNHKNSDLADDENFREMIYSSKNMTDGERASLTSIINNVKAPERVLKAALELFKINQLRETTLEYIEHSRTDLGQLRTLIELQEDFPEIAKCIFDPIEYLKIEDLIIPLSDYEPLLEMAENIEDIKENLSTMSKLYPNQLDSLRTRIKNTEKKMEILKDKDLCEKILITAKYDQEAVVDKDINIEELSTLFLSAEKKERLRYKVKSHGEQLNFITNIIDDNDLDNDQYDALDTLVRSELFDRYLGTDAIENMVGLIDEEQYELFDRFLEHMNNNRDWYLLKQEFENALGELDLLKLELKDALGEPNKIKSKIIDQFWDLIKAVPKKKIINQHTGEELKEETIEEKTVSPLNFKKVGYTRKYLRRAKCFDNIKKKEEEIETYSRKYALHGKLGISDFLRHARIEKCGCDYRIVYGVVDDTLVYCGIYSHDGMKKRAAKIKKSEVKVALLRD